MKITVHRGTAQIGGTCIELQSQGARLILDVGLPLNASDINDPGVLPVVPGLFASTGHDPSILGVLVSHAHQDHHGLLKHVRPEIPIHATQASRMLMEAGEWLFGDGPAEHPWVIFKPFVPFSIGPFRITPFLVDHSAFDACAFLIEIDGKRIFYSGDFRGHGRKSKLFTSLVSDPPRNIDVLLMEGTMLGRTSEDVPTETTLENRFVEVFDQRKGVVLCTASSMNIDRLVTIYRAACRTGRLLVLDLFTALILDRLADHSQSLPHPSPNFPNLRVWYPWAWSRLLARRHGARILYPYRNWKLDKTQLAKGGNTLVVMVKPSVLSDLELIDFGPGDYVYSQWKGSFQEPKQAKLNQHLQDQGFAFHLLHTSGHAVYEDLASLVKALAPKVLVPIHTEHPDQYLSFGVPVRLLQDGQTLDI